jgi:hypothetical protein
MGALDDAIREHLELKRRHGASDDDIRRAEAEALGPARREPAAESMLDEIGMPAPVEGVDAAPVPADAVADAPPPPPGLEPEPFVPEPEPEPYLAEPVAEVPVEPVPVEPPPVEPPPVEPPPVTAFDPGGDDPDRTRTAILDDPLGEPPPAPPIHHEPGPDEPPAPARPQGVAPIDAEPPPPADEDVLEETPDFLQETPEHDRLWFEQKPPRDFDFDD